MSPVNLNTMLVLFHGKLASGGEGGALYSNTYP